MNVIHTALTDVRILEPKAFSDERGFFFESFNQARFEEAVGRPLNFVQDNQSRSVQHVLRGMHFQVVRPQGKLVRVLRGEIYDVVVDLRPDSPDFGRWEGHTLSADNRRQLWVPEGFAHGFLTMSEVADVAYKVTEYWFPEHEKCLLWSDDQLAIQWPLSGSPIVAEKDRNGQSFEALRRFL